MQIEVYLDDVPDPFQILKPPERFSIDTKTIADGEHRLIFKTVDNGSITGQRVVPFTVRNGPSIAVHGISDKDTLSGTVSLLANAYGASRGDEFEPLRMETPAPVPTWAWVLVMGIVAWGAGYITLETHAKKIQDRAAVGAAITLTPVAISENQTDDSSFDWAILGEQVYGNNCASCHQGSGAGLPGVFPPLASNAVVLAEDPAEHIKTIINGLTGKVIDGVAYASPMPAFGSILSNEEIAAVVNHERTQWNNNAPTVTLDDVAAQR